MIMKTLYLGFVIQDIVNGFLYHPFTRLNTAPIVRPNLLYCFIEPQCQIKNLIFRDYVFAALFYLVIEPFPVVLRLL
jgi:hypothetical protein